MEDAVSFLRVGVLGLRFSGSSVAIGAPFVVAGGVGIWYLAAQRR